MVKPVSIEHIPAEVIEAVRLHDRQRQCSANGHDYQHLVNGTGELLQVHCGCCGRTWATGPLGKLYVLEHWKEHGLSTVVREIVGVFSTRDGAVKAAPTLDWPFEQGSCSVRASDDDGYTIRECEVQG